jgi:hypothetical protein
VCACVYVCVCVRVCILHNVKYTIRNCVAEGQRLIALPGGGSGCELASAPLDSEVQCPEGHILMRSDGWTECLQFDVHTRDVICPSGQVLLETPGGAVCQYPEAEVPTPPSCIRGQRATQTEDGVVCVDIEEVKPSCQPGETLVEGERGRFDCVTALPAACPPDSVPTQTRLGIRCVAMTTESPPCPAGLVPVNTPVGIVCRYVAGPKLSHRHQCPPGQTSVQTEHGYGCEISIPKKSDNTCPPGQSIIHTHQGPRCDVDPVHTPLIFDGCPEGQVPVHGPSGTTECREIMEPEMKPTSPCPSGLRQVATRDGIRCMYRPIKPTVTTDVGPLRPSVYCPLGQILKQTEKGFFCEDGQPDLLVHERCPGDDIVAQTYDGLQCIDEQTAMLMCTGTVSSLYSHL